MLEKITKIPSWQKARYGMILLSTNLFFAPFLVIPGLFGSKDFCGPLCMRRFYLYFPGMVLEDLSIHTKASLAGAFFLAGILIVTFFYGRLWCSFLCPMGGVPELISRTLNDRVKIEYRALPQVGIRYGYFSFYVVMMPMLGISACTLCNFITLPRIFDALAGSERGITFLLSSVGLVNLSMVALLGFFANKGRAYCAFLCPIGAIDALVNRLGAMFPWTRRIRVERDRCIGCTLCAQACMCGAIEMMDGKAVVDHLACMSCHECQDVCHHGAIAYLVKPPVLKRHHKKKDEPLPPLPQWTTFGRPLSSKKGFGILWQRVFMVVALSLALLFWIVTQTEAAPRKVDPDGCLVCHGLQNLEFIDENGLKRVSSIDTAHYFGSLHGSIPCRDCHRKIQSYPHEIENGAVDCSESCHLNEPSQGVRYSHKPLTDEYHQSAHGEGPFKGFTAGNRPQEWREGLNPSCRTCHQNGPYIAPEKFGEFRELFQQCDRECGSCHQGEVWRSQYSGHILRRFLGARWTKEEINDSCIGCHEDRGKMGKIRRPHPDHPEVKIPVSQRFLEATESYRMTLHGKLIERGNPQGATCLECHSPGGLKHDIRSHLDPHSSTHAGNLSQTCGTAGCHSYSSSFWNVDFNRTEMHSETLLPTLKSKGSFPRSAEDFLFDWDTLKRWTEDLMPQKWGPWEVTAAGLVPISILVGFGNLLWRFFSRTHGKKWPLFGGEHFQRKMLKRTPKGKRKAKIEKKKPLNGTDPDPAVSAPKDTPATSKNPVLNDEKSRPPLTTMLLLLATTMVLLITPSRATERYWEVIETMNAPGIPPKIAQKISRRLEKPLGMPLKPAESGIPFHHQAASSKATPSESSFCSQCHSMPPHRRGNQRAFLNQHTQRLRCLVCHGKEQKFGAVQVVSGHKKPALLLDRHFQGSSSTPSANSGAANALLKQWNHEELPSKRHLLDLYWRIHWPIQREGSACLDCHKKEQRILEWKSLPYTAEERRSIEQNRIAEFMERLRRSKGSIKLTKILR